MSIRNPILEHLQQDARLTAAEIAVMIDQPEEEVAAEITTMEEEGIILAYKTLVNPAHKEEETVSCLIEVSVQPERGYGFDKIAERIYKFPEVQSVFLVSGGYDLLVLVEGKSIRDVANFVTDKLSTLPDVRSTASHFLLKKYKELGTILVDSEPNERIPITP